MNTKNAHSHHALVMHPQTGEKLVSRHITFRASTFDAFKAYCRDHEARTGVVLTNSSVVDKLLRKQLSEFLNHSQ